MKLLLPVLVGTTIVLAVSCKKQGFLDQTETSNLTEESVFSDSASTMAFLTNIYTQIGFSANPNRFGNGGLDVSSDEGEIASTSSITTSVQFATGSVNPAIVNNDAWRIPYAQIRNVNKFLKNLHKSPMNTNLKTRVKAEARFLRAWYYAIMLKHYGSIPLVGDTIYSETGYIPAKRNTYQECVEYIVAECDAAAQDLPVVQTGIDWGRAGRGSCLALKARVLLYAASPLFNGSNFTDDAQLKSVVGYPTADPERWKKAADAAEAVIATNAYQLYVNNNPTPGYGFQDIFTLRPNKEYIFARMQGGNRELESLWQPPSRGGSRNGAFPYQELVDAFGMANGKSITDPASGYDPNNPYKDRDPRLEYTIIHDQSPLAQVGVGGFMPVDIFTGPGSGQDAVRIGTPTGYYTNKMLDPEITANNIHGSNRCLPLMRYAEVLLNYAEAKNEYIGPTAEVYSAVEAIRQRAGLNPYQLPQGLSQSEMRAIIRNERQKELAFEAHRFWDVRRWMIAEQTQDKQMTGMEVKRQGSTVTYTVFPVRKHNFRKAMYFWPIPQSEVAKSPELLQNPYY